MSVRLHLNFGLKFVQCSEGVALGGEQCNPHVPAHVIHKQKKIFLTMGSHRRNQATKISMVRIQQTLRTLLCQRREGAPLQFGRDVIGADMVDVLDAGIPCTIPRSSAFSQCRSGGGRSIHATTTRCRAWVQPSRVAAQYSPTVVTVDSPFMAALSLGHTQLQFGYPLLLAE
jgi:hypothetical protein